MDWPTFQRWLVTSSLVRIGLVLFGAMCVAAALGVVMRLLRSRAKGGAGSDAMEALRRSLDAWPPAVFDRWGPPPTAPNGKIANPA